MKNLTQLLVALVVSWPFLSTSCRCGETTKPHPDAGTATVPTVTVPPPVPAPIPPPKPKWEPVLDLKEIETFWGEGREAKDTPGAEILGRENAKAEGREWGIPYPWRLYVKLKPNPEWDCGFFNTIEEGRWRVGYCLGGSLDPGERHARRIMLDKKENKLRIRIGKDVDLVFSEEEE